MESVDHEKRLWAWCKNTLPLIRNCGQATQDRIKKSLKEHGLIAECKHERAKFVQDASGNKSWYQCEACGEVVS